MNVLVIVLYYPYKMSTVLGEYVDSFRQICRQFRANMSTVSGAANILCIFNIFSIFNIIEK